MKKMLIKAALLAVAVSLCVSGFACGEPEQTSEPAQTDVLLSGFESSAELTSMSFSNLRGKVELVSDEAYVTEGQYAAKLTMMGKTLQSDAYYEDNEFYLYPGNNYLTKTDYSDVVRYTLDVYNAFSRSVELAFGYNNPRANDDNYLFGYRTLEPGANHLVFEVDNGAVSAFVDVASVKNFFFQIEGRNKDEDPVVLVFDNFRAEVSDADYTPSGSDSVIDFSDPADFARFGEFGASTSYLRRPRFTENTDLQYVLSGRSSMKIEFFAKRAGEGVDCVGFRSKDYTLTGWDTADQDSTYLSYDLYNATDRTITVSMTVFSNVNETYAAAVTVEPHSWAAGSGRRILLRDLNDRFAGTGLNVMTVTFQFGGLEPGDCLYLDNLSLITE